MSNNNILTKNIPNLFTLLNLFCGLVAIILSFHGGKSVMLAGYFIYIAAIFDFFDGFAARALKATSAFGKELDSLSDMVSFGVAPSVILYAMLKTSMQVKQFAFTLPAVDILILLSPLLVAIFSAIRLAKFNIDTRQSESFLGLATPACAMFIASLPIIAEFTPNNLFLDQNVFGRAMDKNIYFFLASMYFCDIVNNWTVIVPISLFLSMMLVINLPMFSLKFKNYSFEDNKLKYSFLIVSTLFFAVLQILAVPIIFILYVAFSIFNNKLDKSINKRAKENLDRLFAEEIKEKEEEEN